MEPIPRRGFLGLLGAAVAGTSAAAARSSHTVDTATTIARAPRGEIVDVDLGTVLWPSLQIHTSVDGSSAHWISNVRPTLGQRVRVALGADTVFVGAIIRYTMQTPRHPAFGPYWDVAAESDEVIAGRWQRANPNLAIPNFAI